jgi:hypothetical protein
LTLTELMLMIALIGVLVALLIALLADFTRPSGMPHLSRCGKNLSQIMGACVAYSTTEEVPWPSPWPRGQELSAIHIADAHEARLTTVHIFSILAKVMEMPNSVCKCPASSRAGPVSKPTLDRAGALLWGAGPDHAVSYAWDWASPADPGSARVVGADRSPANHKGKAMVVYGDSHTRPLRAQPGTATGMVTEDNDGTPVTTIVGNPDAVAPDGVVDNIYSPAGDDGDQLSPGKGGDRGSWVK